MSDELILIDDDIKTISQESYKVLIVDDDETIHSITIASLKNKLFDGKKLDMISAMSAKEAMEVLSQYDDIALALIDVVMETPEAGLNLVNYIRNDLKNETIRLVLRTGQPAQAPEENIIDLYDINDYKEKTELISQKLYTLVRTSIKQYELIKNLKHKIDEATDELNRKNKLIVEQSRLVAMGEIIGMVAHQWRQPLAVIGMISNNIIMDIDFDKVNNESLKENLKSIDEQVVYLSNTIDKFNSVLMDTESREIDVNDVLDESCQMLNNNFLVEKDYTEGLSLYTKKNDLIQIILHLIKNSLDAYAQNNIEDKIIYLTTKRDENNIIIEIKDNAGGISDEVMKKIFDPYFSTKDEKNGTGLGLYISKVILEKHFGGSLVLESQNNSTVCTITLGK